MLTPSTCGAYPVPENEEKRLKALRDSGMLDTPEEEVFNGIIRMAKAVFGMPIVVFNLIDSNRQWFKAQCGLGVNETSRDVSMCAHAIIDDTLMIIPDATADARFKDNPFVTGGPNIRFYAGAPIIIPDGIILGTLCVIDNQPRDDFDEKQQRILWDMANLIAHIIELRMVNSLRN